MTLETTKVPRENGGDEKEMSFQPWIEEGNSVMKW